MVPHDIVPLVSAVSITCYRVIEIVEDAPAVVTEYIDEDLSLVSSFLAAEAIWKSPI